MSMMMMMMIIIPPRQCIVAANGRFFATACRSVVVERADVVITAMFVGRRIGHDQLSVAQSVVFQPGTYGRSVLLRCGG